MVSSKFPKLLTGLLLGLSLLLYSCGAEPAADATEDETTTEEATPEAAPAKDEFPTTDAYTVTVLEDGIASPRKEMKGTVGGAAVIVNYGSPSVKERQTWGGLVPLDDIWRTGANACTTIEFPEDVMVEGQPLPAGKYGLFTQASEDGSMIIIFNKNSDMWGAGDYDEAEDALRVTVLRESAPAASETMEFKIMDGAVVLHWDDWMVPFSVRTA
jgi:hypothetical protein